MKNSKLLFPLREISQAYLNGVYLVTVAAITWILSTWFIVWMLRASPMFAGLAAGFNTIILSLVTVILIMRMGRGDDVARDLLELKLTARALDETTSSILNEVRR